MGNRRHTDIELRLSLYLDGALDEVQTEELEKQLRADAALRRQLDGLRRTRDMLASAEDLPPSPFFAERTFNAIRQHADVEQAHHAVHGRSLPAAAGVFVALLIAVSALTWWQGGSSIVRYFSSTGEQVQQVYEDAILKGWIMPLFRRSDQDQMLEFAMFGTLPLDGEAGTVLRVDPASTEGYRVELVGGQTPRLPRPTVRDLYAQLRPTETQRRTLDTLFAAAQKRIEAAVLLDKRQRLAIDPSLPHFQHMLLSGIAANLTDEQRERLGGFLSVNNAAYTFRAQAAEAALSSTPSAVLASLRELPPPEEYVLFTSDSIAFTRMRVDTDSLRRLMFRVEHRLQNIDIPVEHAIRRAAEAVVVSRRSPDAPSRIRVSVPAAPEAPDAPTMIAITIDEKELKLEQQFIEQEMRVMMRSLTPTRPGRPQRHSIVVGTPPPAPFPPQVRVRVDRRGQHSVTVDIDTVLHDVMRGLEERGIPLPPHIEIWDDEAADSSARFELQEYFHSADSSARQWEWQSKELQQRLLEMERQLQPPPPPKRTLPPPEKI